MDGIERDRLPFIEMSKSGDQKVQQGAGASGGRSLTKLDESTLQGNT